MIQGGGRDLHAVLGAHMYEFVTNKKNRINTEYGGRVTWVPCWEALMISEPITFTTC